MDPIQIGARGDSLHPWAFIGEYQRERVWLMMQLREAISRVGERGTIVFIWDLWELESPQVRLTRPCLTSLRLER